ncbi:hypothetical protein [Amycolatopsis dendrobii]|uniref:Uncharacterized protein n=1 Tax=Amycolatopsis dendrobii TaxID=2760662 RepID=A0A7W3ZEZ6_9PSEU|nr:hypothetical protein [Amycolatopsis dendrobii]MBB1158489.1 hypothetical protein [Amycolatopsis dendrobii]
MDELAGHVATWGAGTLVLTALVFGFFPVFAVNLLARVYPKGHPRRAELVAELHDVPRRERLIWVAEQLATVLFDGVPERVRARRRGASAERERREFEELTAVEQMERLRNLIARLRSFGSDDLMSEEIVGITAEKTRVSGEIVQVHVRAHRRPGFEPPPEWPSIGAVPAGSWYRPAYSPRLLHRAPRPAAFVKPGGSA